MKWILIDTLGFRVRYLYAVNGVPGSYHELGIRHHYQGSGRPPKYLRGLEPKVDDGREMIKLRHHRPRYMHQETFVKTLLKFRGVPAERLIEETTAAVTEWDATRRKRRLKYRNLNRVNASRQMAKVERQWAQATGEDEPILPLRS